MDEYKRRRRRSLAVMSMFLGSLGGVIDNVDIATFDSDGNDLKALIVGIEPVQSGTGDPSPDNIRPITGHSSVNVIVSPTLNPLDGTITNIPLGTIVYGGTLDVLTGVLTVDIVKDTFTWGNGTNATVLGNYTRKRFPLSYALDESVAARSKQLCSVAPFKNSYSSDDCHLYCSGAYAFVFLPNDTSADLSFDICYPLATPQIIQLTGKQIATFLGTNNVWCDSGKIIHLEY